MMLFVFLWYIPVHYGPQSPGPAQSAVGRPESPLTLWYRQPAAQWVEALPVGNGRLGAMVFGGVVEERLQLNEDTLWAGGPYDPSHAAAREALPRVRRLIADGAYVEAERLIMEQVIARPPREMPYQTVGDVTVTMAGGSSVTEYRRSLDLDTAIARTSFRVGNVRYAREVFASPVDQVIVCRLTALGIASGRLASWKRLLGMRCSLLRFAENRENDETGACRSQAVQPLNKGPKLKIKKPDRTRVPSGTP